MFNTLSYPLIFAHRGDSSHAPENTLAAFKMACAKGAQAMELDAKLSKDGKIVVIHDPTLDRTTDGHGYLRDFTFAQLRELDAGSSFSAEFRGEPIPSLEEVFAEVGKKMLINVELTNYATPGDALVEKVVDLVKRMDLVNDVVFSSFLPGNLSKARRLLPGVPLGYLTLPGKASALITSLARRFTPHDTLNPELRDVTETLVAKTHRSGRKVFVYTVNQAEDMRRLFKQGVDGIFTDDPALGLQIVKGEY